MLFFEYYTANRTPSVYFTSYVQRGQYISYIIMYYRSPCFFFFAGDSVFIFQEHSSVSELMLRGSSRPLRCSRTLARPRSCSGTSRQTTPCSGTGAPLSDHNSGTSPLARRPVLGDCLDHSPTTRVLTTCDWRLAYFLL